MKKKNSSQSNNSIKSKLQKRRNLVMNISFRFLSTKIYRLLTLKIVIKNIINQRMSVGYIHNGILSLVISLELRRKASEKSALFHQ